MKLRILKEMMVNVREKKTEPGGRPGEGGGSRKKKQWQNEAE